VAPFPSSESSPSRPLARRRALVIVNPNAGGGNAGDQVIAGLREAGLELAHTEGDSPEELVRTIRRHRQQVDVVVVAGGDGTVRAAAPALVETDTPLALIPLGTANDFARGLGVPQGIEAACELAARGQVRSIDAAVCDGRWFVNDASIGLAVEAVRSADSATKKHLGRLGYLAALASALRNLEPFHVRLTCDGRRHELDALQVTIGNGRYFGGGLVIGPDAALDDGLLDACILHPAPWWRLAALVPSLRAGRTPTSGITTVRGERIRVETDRPMKVTTDGDVTARTPVTLSVRPGALRVVC
jgi:diacylglycerol kinase (ATP)